MKHFILEWKSLLLTYFTQQQDKAVDELVQPANSKAPAQPPTGSGPVITSALAALRKLLTELLSRLSWINRRVSPFFPPEKYHQA